MTDKNKFSEEESQGYKVSILGRNVAVTDGMKTHAINKLAKLERFHAHILDIHVTLDIQKIEHICTIVLIWSHFKIKVHASSTDMYASIDEAVARLQNKVRRWKKKMQDHHNKGVQAIDLRVNVLQRPYDELEEYNAEIEQSIKMQDAWRPPAVLGEETMRLKTLVLDEAVMKIDLSGDAFLMFKDEADRKLKLIYRREDGNYGLIEIFSE